MRVSQPLSVAVWTSVARVVYPRHPHPQWRQGPYSVSSLFIHDFSPSGRYSGRHELPNSASTFSCRP